MIDIWVDKGKKTNEEKRLRAEQTLQILEVVLITAIAIASLFEGNPGPAAERAGAELAASELKLSTTVANHLDDLTKAGESARPYGDSRLLIQEIMESKPPVADPGGVPGGLRWDVPGTMNGAKGTYQLVVDPTSKTILHFVFTTPK